MPDALFTIPLPRGSGRIKPARRIRGQPQQLKKPAATGAQTAAAAEKPGCCGCLVKKPRIFYVLSAVGSGFRGLFRRFYLARISLRMKQI